MVHGGRSGLGALLTVAFILQVTPSLWTAYRTARLTGVAAGTWLLILGELSCWTIFGLYQSDPRLITLGITGSPPAPSCSPGSATHAETKRSGARRTR